MTTRQNARRNSAALKSYHCWTAHHGIYFALVRLTGKRKQKLWPGISRLQAFPLTTFWNPWRSIFRARMAIHWRNPKFKRRVLGKNPSQRKTMTVASNRFVARCVRCFRTSLTSFLFFFRGWLWRTIVTVWSQVSQPYVMSVLCKF